MAISIIGQSSGRPWQIESSFTYDLILPATGSAPLTVQRFIGWLIEEATRF